MAGLRALVVGTGFGVRIQVPALRAAGFEVVGLIGNDPERTRERAALSQVPGAFTDLDAAIDATGANAVAIASPPHTHAPLVFTAARRGLHILCEKPFALDSAEARAMQTAAESAGVVNLIGHEFRFVPAWAVFSRAVSQGLIGTPRFASFTSFTPMLASPKARMPDWWFDTSAGGGWLGAQGSHLVDWVRCVLGEIASLSGVLPTVGPHDGGAEDSYLFRFRTAGGAEAVLQQTTAAWGPPATVNRVAGSKGTIWMEGEAVYFADGDGERTIEIGADLALPPIPPLSPDPRYQSAKWQMLVPVELPPYIRLCEAFAALIEGRPVATPVPLPTFAEGVATMAVLDAVRASATDGGALVALGA